MSESENENLQTKIRKSQWIELTGEFLYIVSSAVYIVDGVINNGSLLYLLASIFFMLAAIFMFIHSIYLIIKIRIKNNPTITTTNNETFSNNV